MPGAGLKISNRKDPLLVIPGVGPSIAEDLHELGVREVGDLRDRNPREMYERLQVLRGSPQDRCVLYVFRCAVYFASTREPDPELLKWWNWKNRSINESSEKI